MASPGVPHSSNTDTCVLSMAILSNTTVLNCRHIDETLQFYQQLLQFVVVNRRDTDQLLQWAHLMHGATAIMLRRVDDDLPRTDDTPAPQIELYFFVDKLQELHHFIKAKGGSPSEVRITDYRMQEFEMNDPEGNLLVIGEKS